MSAQQRLAGDDRVRRPRLQLAASNGLATLRRAEGEPDLAMRAGVKGEAGARPHGKFDHRAALDQLEDDQLLVDHVAERDSLATAVAKGHQLLARCRDDVEALPQGLAQHPSA
jgi:hypothetical protein